jgi:transglutaminase-like putative cysteine protease
MAIGLWLLAGMSSARGEETHVPEPRFDRVDHSKPQALLEIDPNVGDEKLLCALARQLKREDPRGTLSEIGRWIERNLRHDPNAPPVWRSFEVMRKDKTYGGCADHAVVFGTLARCAGIPTVWVKTMDVEWIREFREGRPEATQRHTGHVFLEVHVDGRWMLLDAQALRLYEEYDPKTRILPGNRFAYDKGGKPFDLVLSCRWEEWLAQTQRYFRSIDLRAVPWSRSQDLSRPWHVHVAGNAPVHEWVASVARRLGWRVVASFNGEYDRHLALARGTTLVVTCANGKPMLPPATWAAWLPEGHEELCAKGAVGGRRWLDRRLEDGTRVILVPAQDRDAVEWALLEALR